MTQVETLIASPTRGNLPVLILGLLTSAAALFGVWQLDRVLDDFNIMGLTYFYVVPAGAIMVGGVAGLGYGLGSWLTGVRISSRLLWAIVFLQSAVYFGAQYIEYYFLIEAAKAKGAAPDKLVGFFEYFDNATREIAFKGRGDEGYGSPVGIWGYGFRAIELAGFALSGLWAPVALSARAYCSKCQIYMRKALIGQIPTAAPSRKINRKQTEELAAFEQENKATFEAGIAELDQLREHGEAGRFREFADILEARAAEQKEVGKRTGRVAVHLEACRQCDHGQLSAAHLSGHGDKLQMQDLGRSPLSEDLVRDLRSRC